jgi:predicted phosphodiesterase
MTRSSEEETPFSTISIVAVSDTRSLHSSLSEEWPSGDLFIHAGNLTQHGTKEELQSAIEWLVGLPYSHKVVIAGNHDIGLEKPRTYQSSLESTDETYTTADALINLMSEGGITYLSPETPSVEISVRECDLRIYGLPFAPLSPGPSAFMRSRSEDTWANVHGNYDILVSHAPPKGHLDQTRFLDHIGCTHFLAAIKRLKPRAAIFGHVYESRGKETRIWGYGRCTVLYNVAIMNRYHALSPPTAFNLIVPRRFATAAE